MWSLLIPAFANKNVYIVFKVILRMYLPVVPYQILKTVENYIFSCIRLSIRPKPYN
jgi:hypothetical protein